MLCTPLICSCPWWPWHFSNLPWVLLCFFVAHWMVGSLGSAPLPFTQHQLQFTELLCAQSILSEKCIINFISLGNRAAALIAQEFLPKESQNWRETPCIPIHRCGNWGPRRDKFHATPGLTWDPDTVQDASAGCRPSLTLPSADTDPWPTGSSTQYHPSPQTTLNQFQLESGSGRDRDRVYWAWKCCQRLYTSFLRPSLPLSSRNQDTDRVWLNCEVPFSMFLCNSNSSICVDPPLVYLLDCRILQSSPGGSHSYTVSHLCVKVFRFESTFIGPVSLYDQLTWSAIQYCTLIGL